jgi:hypothetical protein
MALPSNAQITSAANGNKGDFYNALLLLRQEIANLQAKTVNFADNEEIFGDGSATKFTLKFTPSPVTSLQIFKNGMHIYLEADFTVNGKIVTFAAAPAALDSVYAYYRY